MRSRAWRTSAMVIGNDIRVDESTSLRVDEVTARRPSTCRLVDSSTSFAQVRLPHLGAAQELLPGAALHDGAGLQHVALVRDAQREVRVLLDQKDGHSGAIDLLDD